MQTAEVAEQPIAAEPLSTVSAGEQGGFRLNVRFAPDKAAAPPVDAIPLDRATVSRALSTFDTLDRVGPRFRLTDAVRVDVAANGTSAGGLRLESIWLRSSQASMRWGVSVLDEHGERLDSEALEIDDFTAFRPAVRARCGALLDTTDRDAAVAAVALVLRGSIDVIDFRLDEAKVGFVDEHETADSGEAVEACHIGFSVVLRLDAVDQANRQVAEAMLGELLDEAFDADRVPRLIRRNPARHCELTVSHPTDGDSVRIA